MSTALSGIVILAGALTGLGAGFLLCLAIMRDDEK